MYSKPFLLIPLLAFTTLFSGCATAPIAPTQWIEHQSTVEKITQFSVTGKLAYISPNERLSASFYWQQDTDNLSLRLSNFLGATLLKLDVSPHQAVLIDNEGTQHQGENAKSLLKRLTGVNLPISDLMLWIKGIPAKNNAYTLGEDNRLASLYETKADQTSSKGWKVTYEDYDRDTDNLLPSSITLTYAEQEVKLRVSKWEYTK